MPKTVATKSAKQTANAASNKLKSFLPYIFPLLSLALVIFMFARWYRSKTAETPSDFLNSESFQVEELNQEAAEQIMRGSTDYKSVTLTGDEEASGEIRYQEVDGKVNFTITTNLPASQESYAVWLKALDSEAQRYLFALESTKAGYVGSAVLQAEVLPVELVVSKASDLLLQDVVLRGTIEAPQAAD